MKTDLNFTGYLVVGFEANAAQLCTHAEVNLTDITKLEQYCISQYVHLKLSLHTKEVKSCNAAKL